MVTAPALQPAGASSLVAGATVSIRTVAVRSASMCPAASIERYATVCTPSPATATDVPAVQAGASSSLYSVTATPEPPASVAANVTVTAWALHPAGASSVVTGGVVSGHATVDAVRVAIGDRFPAASVASTPSVYVVPQTRPVTVYAVAAVSARLVTLW